MLFSYYFFLIFWIKLGFIKHSDRVIFEIFIMPRMVWWGIFTLLYLFYFFDYYFKIYFLLVEVFFETFSPRVHQVKTCTL